MTRSIFWVTSAVPPSPLPDAGLGLPQPRSRMALAAAIRVASGESALRITPTRTLSAVRVWLRARERISVRVLGISEARRTARLFDLVLRQGRGMGRRPRH